MAKTVIGVFKSRSQAEEAVEKLRRKGFAENEISIVAKDDRGGGGGGEGGMMKAGNVSDGVGWGGALGGLAGLMAGAGALAIPGIGPIVAAGPIAGALSGAATGGVAGGLIDFGIPEARGREYEKKIKEGGILAVLRAEDRKIDEAADILRETGAEDVETHSLR